MASDANASSTTTSSTTSSTTASSRSDASTMTRVERAMEEVFGPDSSSSDAAGDETEDEELFPEPCLPK